MVVGRAALGRPCSSKNLTVMVSSATQATPNSVPPLSAMAGAICSPGALVIEIGFVSEEPHCTVAISPIPANATQGQVATLLRATLSEQRWRPRRDAQDNPPERAARLKDDCYLCSPLLE